MIPFASLEIGSVVRLISGSPKMAVEKLVPAAPASRGSSQMQLKAVEAAVHVVWHLERLGLQRAVFSPEVLTWPAPSVRPAFPEPDAE